tara:strand:- start:458 stop:694 length:237 start_codon:yes stop_codon:yes gene_type:complete
MKRLLLLLIASLALPTAVNAESVWLWLSLKGPSGGPSQEKILMNSLEKCKEEGERWVMAGSKASLDRNWRRFHCIIGK